MVEPKPTHARQAKSLSSHSPTLTVRVCPDQKERVTQVIEKEIEHGDDPHVVAEVVYDVVTAKWPHMHYPVGQGVMLSRLHRFVPSRIFDSVFRKRSTRRVPLIGDSMLMVAEATREFGPMPTSVSFVLYCDTVYRHAWRPGEARSLTS